MRRVGVGAAALTRQRREYYAACDAAQVQIDKLQRFAARVPDVERGSIRPQRHLVRQLAHWNRIEKGALLEVEHLDTVVAGIGDIQPSSWLIEHQVLQPLIALSEGKGL